MSSNSILPEIVAPPSYMAIKDLLSKLLNDPIQFGEYNPLFRKFTLLAIFGILLDINNTSRENITITDNQIVAFCEGITSNSSIEYQNCITFSDEENRKTFIKIFILMAIKKTINTDIMEFVKTFFNSPIGVDMVIDDIYIERVLERKRNPEYEHSLLDVIYAIKNTPIKMRQM